MAVLLRHFCANRAQTTRAARRASSWGILVLNWSSAVMLWAPRSGTSRWFSWCVIRPLQQQVLSHAGLAQDALSALHVCFIEYGTQLLQQRLTTHHPCICTTCWGCGAEPAAPPVPYAGPRVPGCAQPQARPQVGWVKHVKGEPLQGTTMVLTSMPRMSKTQTLVSSPAATGVDFSVAQRPPDVICFCQHLSRRSGYHARPPAWSRQSNTTTRATPRRVKRRAHQTNHAWAPMRCEGAGVPPPRSSAFPAN